MELANINKNEIFINKILNLATPKNSALIIEDCISSALIIKHFLAELNINSEIVNEGQRAMAKINNKKVVNNNFNLIIIDHNLPDISGDKLTKILRDKSYQGIILGISGTSSIDVCKKYYSAGCDYFLNKNLLTDQLEYTIKFVSETKDIFQKIGEGKNFKNLAKPKPVILKSFTELQKVYRL